MTPNAEPSFRPAGHLARPLAVALFGFFLLAIAPAAFALSEIPQEDVPAPPTGDEPIESEPLPPVTGVPAPDPVTPPAGETLPPADTPAPPPAEQPVEPPADTPPPEEAQPDGPPPEVIYDLSKLPAPARRMRELIIEAARTGDLEKLRPLIGSGDNGTQLAIGGVDGDPIEYLRSISGDAEPGQGQEILAILEEVLSAGFVHMDAGTPEELYVWPYFFARPLESLTPAQRVELFKIVTAGDYEEMRSYGAYTFYRAGISPEGQWTFFVAGD